jgi:hypothetical protein
MKKSVTISTAVLYMLLFSSCQSKTEQLLIKKWDCIKVENPDLVNSRFQNAEDSINTVQLMSALESLTWTFKKGHQYECAVGNRITVTGTYGIMDDNKTLICTPDTKNSINRYTINTLTENDMILSNSMGNIPLVLHFKSR